MNRDERSPRAIGALCLVAASIGLWGTDMVRAGETLDERRARIERMDPAQRAQLLRAQEQFAALDPSERQRLRELNEKIEAHPRSDELLDVMEQYCQFVRTLPAFDRAQLRKLPPEEKIKKIRQLREAQADRWKPGLVGMRGFGLGERLRKLAWEDREGLTRWFDQYMAPKAAELVKSLPEAQQEGLLEELKQAEHDPARRRSLFARMWVLRQFAHPGKSLRPDDQALEELRSQLSPKTQQWLGDLRPETQRRILGGLVDGFVFLESHKELGEYLQHELSPEEWDRLTSLPPEEMRRHLWFRYLRSKWPDMFRGFPDRRPGGWRPRGRFRPPFGGSPGAPRGPQPGPRPPGPPSKQPPG